MRVFVAGATGAIGQQLVPQLVQAGHHVTAITRSEDKLKGLQDLGARAVVCDVFEPVRLREVMTEAKPNAIINQLTDLPQHLNPRAMESTYSRNNRVRREGTNNLLDVARQAGVERFLVQSSGFWYAPRGDRVKREDAPLHVDARPPIGPAVTTMKEVEVAVLGSPDLEGIVLRYGLFYGPRTWYARDGDVGMQVRQWRYPVIGRGDGVFSFIHVEDAASATVVALEGGRRGIYNVADDDPASLREWLPIYAQALGARKPLKVPAFVARLVAGEAVVEWMEGMRGASNEKIKDELAWRPKYSTWREGFTAAIG